MKNNARKGFTLIELLIVIAIIGILASVVLVGLGPSRRAGLDARRISDLRQIQAGLELYNNAIGSYPLADAPADAVAAFAAFTSAASDITNAIPSISSIPNDPNTTRNYGYASDSSGYILYAILDGNLPAGVPDYANVNNLPYAVAGEILCGVGGYTPAVGAAQDVYCVSQ